MLAAERRNEILALLKEEGRVIVADLSKKYDVTVATSDGLEQIIIRGQGCRLISARELEEEIARKSKEILENYRG